MLTITQLVFFNSSKTVNDYNFVDISSCFWSRYYTESASCSFVLPEYVIDNNLAINIGTNINQKSFSIVPFDWCMNSVFIINVIDNETGIIPSWILINNTENSVTFDLNQTSSVGNKTLIQYLKLKL